MSEPRGLGRRYAPTALPSVTARALAFVAIVVGGICGGLIAYAVTDLQCGRDDDRAANVVPAPPPERGDPTSSPDDHVQRDQGCTVIAGSAGVAGAGASAGAVSVIVVLALRAMGEWRRDLAPDG